MQRVVGFACAVMAILMMVWAIWLAQAGGSGDGLAALGLCLAFLLVAAATLRTRI